MTKGKYIHYCLECDADVIYYTQEVEKHETTKDGVEFDWTEVQAICDECGTEIWVSEITDENIDRRWSAMEKAYGHAIARGLIECK